MFTKIVNSAHAIAVKYAAALDSITVAAASVDWLVILGLYLAVMLPCLGYMASVSLQRATAELLRDLEG